MGAPMIAGKVAIVTIAMTVTFAIGLIIYQGKIVQKCEDAGGVYVNPTVCINPTSIIEVE